MAFRSPRRRHCYAFSEINLFFCDHTFYLSKWVGNVIHVNCEIWQLFSGARKKFRQPFRRYTLSFFYRVSHTNLVNFSAGTDWINIHLFGWFFCLEWHLRVRGRIAMKYYVLSTLITPRRILNTKWLKELRHIYHKSW